MPRPLRLTLSSLTAVAEQMGITTEARRREVGDGRRGGAGGRDGDVLAARYPESIRG